MNIQNTKIFIYGFPAPISTSNKITNILLKRKIEQDTGWTIKNGKINYIMGKVWNNETAEFEPGRGATITIEETLSQSDINIINSTKDDTLDMYSITYYLENKKNHQSYEQYHKNYNDNTYAKVKYRPPSERHQYTQTSQKSHQYTQKSQKSHLKKFKCNVLKDLDDKIKKHIKYNKIAFKPSLNNTKNGETLPTTTSIKLKSQRTHPIFDGRTYKIPQNRNKTDIDATLDGKARGNNNINNTDENINKNANKIGGIYSQMSNKQLLNGKNNEMLNSISTASLNVNNINNKDENVIKDKATRKSIPQKSALNGTKNKIKIHSINVSHGNKNIANIRITPTPSSNTPKQSLAAIPHLKIENINEDAIKIGGTLTASSQNHTSHKNIDNKSIKSITPITGENPSLGGKQLEYIHVLSHQNGEKLIETSGETLSPPKEITNHNNIDYVDENNNIKCGTLNANKIKHEPNTQNSNESNSKANSTHAPPHLNTFIHKKIEHKSITKYGALIQTKLSLWLMFYDIMGGKMLESIAFWHNIFILNVFLY